MDRTRLLTWSAFFVLTLACAAPASAQFFVQYSPSVIVGGSTGSQFVATHPNFDVFVRAATGAPLPGALVEIDFSPAPTIRLIDTQNPGTTVNCATRVVSEFTNAAGEAPFNLRFTGWANPPQVLLRVNGVNQALLPARSTAMSTTIAATGLAALNLFAVRWATIAPEADFDLSGGPVGLPDFNIFAGEYTKPQPAQGLCP